MEFPIQTFIRTPKIARMMITFTVQYVLTDVKTWIEVGSTRKLRVQTLVQLTERHMCPWELQILKIPVVYARQWKMHSSIYGRASLSAHIWY